MLGTVARKLRILGFDCAYSATIDDEELILAAIKENRIIITKDHQLGSNAKKHDIITIELATHTEKEQIIEIAKGMGWKKFEFNVKNAKCSLCNGNLSSVEKGQIVDKVPPRIAQNVREFWVCDDCGHVYWEGTHIRNLEKLIAEINGQL